MNGPSRRFSPAALLLTLCVSTAALAQSPPTISKGFGDGTIPLGGTTTLTFIIMNPNTSTTLTGIAFTDILPSGLQVANTPGLSNTCGGTATAVAASTTISLTGGSLAGSGACNVTVNVTGTSSGVKNNTSGNVSSTNGGTGGTASASVTVVAPPTILKSFSPTTIPLFGTTTMTITIGNPNSTVALTGIGFFDTPPSGLVFFGNITNTCGGSATVMLGTLNLNSGTLAANGSCTVTVGASGQSAGLKTNTTGNVNSTNGGTDGNASADVIVQAGTATPTLTGTPPTATPTNTPTGTPPTATPTNTPTNTPTSTATPTLTATPSSTPTTTPPTATPSNTPSNSPTTTPTGAAPTTTPTGAAANVPTLSPMFFLFLTLALALTALFLMRKSA